jgi:hypothetical protein
VKRILCGLVLAAAVSFSGARSAAAERAAKASLLPPHEIITVVRSTGLAPLGRPARRGNNYVVRAIDEIGQEVRLVVDGRVGEVLSVMPVAGGRRDRARDDEPRNPSIFESGPPIYVRRPPIDSPPIIIDEEDEPPVYRGAAPPVVPPTLMPPVRDEREAYIPPAATPESASPQILTGPRPPAAVPTSPPTEAPDREENVLLPPPPPRFPQRPPPNVKPQQRPTKSAAQPSAATKADSRKSEAWKSGGSKSNPAVPANSGDPPDGSSPPPMQLQN